MSNIATLKEQIILEVRMSLLRVRNVYRADEREKLLQLLENSLEMQLDELVTEATSVGFARGQENVMEAING